MRVTKLYLIRHGQAHCNVPPYGTVAGPNGDKGLTPLGVRQAERLRDRLAATGEIAADVLIASTLRRAMQTAQIIAPALGGLPIVPDDDVQEMRVGDFDGLPWEQVKEQWADHRVDPYRPLGPGGENWPRFHVRVAEALDRIVAEHAGKNVVVVCHGGVVDASFAYFFGLPTLAPGKSGLYTANTSITQWEEEPHDGFSLRWRLVRYNDDLHVRDLDAPERLGWVRLASGERPGGNWGRDASAEGEAEECAS
ncbi:MAG TPA: histidine phosphatase family protein [Ktedonobacterales bacterium]|nr:histidine phosphatase family protein [Ktedonobacterales bacterium]